MGHLHPVTLYAERAKEALGDDRFLKYPAVVLYCPGDLKSGLKLRVGCEGHFLCESLLEHDRLKPRMVPGYVSNTGKESPRKINLCLKARVSFFLKFLHRDIPGGTVVKNPPANSGDTGLIPGPGRSHKPCGAVKKKKVEKIEEFTWL